MADVIRKIGEPRVVIEGLTFDANLHNAVECVDCAEVVIRDCVFPRTESGSVWIVNAGKIEVVGNKFLGAGNPNLHNEDCLTLHQAGDVLIEGNEFAGGDHDSILIRHCRGRKATSRVIRGNTFHQCDGSHITLKEGYSGFLIENNVFRGASDVSNATPGSIADHGGRINHAALQLSGDDHRLLNNRVEKCGKGFLLSCSIRRSDPGQQTCNRTLIQGNVFNSITDHAIELQGYNAEMNGSLNDTRIIGNTFGQVGGDRIHQATPGGSWGTIIDDAVPPVDPVDPVEPPPSGGAFKLVSVSPPSGKPGDTLTLEVTGAGVDRGGVIAAGKRILVVSWTPDKIVAQLVPVVTGLTLPPGPTFIQVRKAGDGSPVGLSNALPLMIVGGTAPDPIEPPPTPDDFEMQVAKLVNVERRKVGLSDLVVSARLRAAADDYAAVMARDGLFSHTGKDGSTIGSRITTAGYKWTTCGENIARGQRTPEAVMYDPQWGWMFSEGHKANILHPAFKDLGVGYILDVRGDTWWVQAFAANGGVPIPVPISVPTATVGTDPAFAAALLVETNKLRAARGLYAFQWHDGLAGVAQAFCEQLVASRTYNSGDAHRGPDGLYVWDRLRKVIPTAQPSNSSENLANNYPSAEAVVKAWSTSPSGHDKNIFHEKWRFMGGGYAYSPMGTHPAIVWVQTFWTGEGASTPLPPPVVTPPTVPPPGNPPSVPSKPPNPRWRPRQGVPSRGK